MTPPMMGMAHSTTELHRELRELRELIGAARGIAARRCLAVEFFWRMKQLQSTSPFMWMAHKKREDYSREIRELPDTALINSRNSRSVVAVHL